MQWSQLTVIETSLIGITAAIIWLTYTVVTLRRISNKESSLRSLLLAISLLCFCLLLFQPKYPVIQMAGRALLLTEHTLTVPDSLPVFALPGIEVTGNTATVPDLATIERNHPEISQVYVAGYGLPPDQLRQLQRLQVEFLGKSVPAGMGWLDYTRKITEGELLKVNGTYTNTSADTASIALHTVEGIRDSVMLSPGTKVFSLQARSKITGKFIGSLSIRQGDSIRSEPLPYEVVNRKALHILLLQAFPSFEMNYLKDWLAAQQHQLQLRARISRDKYSTQQINYEAGRQVLPILSDNNLQHADLLITDAESIRQLSASAQKRLEQAVAQGLGLVLLPDEKWLKKPELLGQRFAVITSRADQFMPVVQQAAQTQVNAGKLLFAFDSSTLLVPLIYSQDQETIAAYLPLGKGRIGTQLAAATFPWLLQGEKSVYSNFWTDIIEGVSRRKQQNKLQMAGAPFLWEGQQANIHLADSALLPLTILPDSGKRQLAQPAISMFSPFDFAYQFQPATSGWMQLYTGNDSSQTWNVYVLPDSAWPDIKRAGWWRENKSLAADTLEQVSTTYPAKQEIPLTWFFLLLVASFGCLWWREKTG